MCTVAVLASDTDVVLLLISFFPEINNELWMLAGTSSKPKNIPIHVIVDKYFSLPALRNNLMSFHALTGCDTTSFFFGVSKKNSI